MNKQLFVLSLCPFLWLCGEKTNAFIQIISYQRISHLYTSYLSTLLLFSIKPTLRKVPRFGVKIERMLLNARKEVGFTVNLKAVKKDQFKSEDARQESQQTPEWSWKKQQAGEEKPAEAGKAS